MPLVSSLLRYKTMRKAFDLPSILLILLSVLALFGILGASYALACGILFGFFFNLSYQAFITKWSSQLLKIAIVTLGFTLPVAELVSTASDSFLMTFSLIGGALVFGLALSRLLKINSQQAWLISSGTAICGGSAIAAVGSSIKAEQHNMVISLAIVFLLNALALFLFPAIGLWLEMSQHQFGLWAALGIHDTSSVVGAASQYGEEALEIATTSKLSRALWIIPVALIASLSQQDGKFSMKLPVFIIFFIVASLAGSFISANLADSINMEKVSTYSKPFSKNLFALSLLWMGTSLNRQAIKSLPFKSLFVAVLLWLIISIGTLTYILNAIH